MSLINTLKYHGRGVVLPVEKIKQTCRELCQEVSYITDFGAGTLFWSKFFADELDLTVDAVDSAYNNQRPFNDNKDIFLKSDILEVIAEEPKGAIFICDVIHHLDPQFWRLLLPQILEIYDVIIIKDIDAGHRFGNFCNRMHDRIINGEKIQNIYPDEIENCMMKAGYVTKREYMPKLWYPHFMITGTKSV